MAVLSRDARQRLIIAEKAMANNDIRTLRIVRDRVFVELVYRRIFFRTGGNVRAWMTTIAEIKRVLFFVSRAHTRRVAQSVDNALELHIRPYGLPTCFPGRRCSKDPVSAQAGRNDLIIN